MNLKKHILLIILSTFSLGLNTVSLKAQETTEVVVRAIAKDAKFIGTSMGGVMVTITNAETGEVLAKGLTEGSTGDTEILVKSPKKRYEKLSTEGSAKFTAHLKIDEPIFVTISTASIFRINQEVTSTTQVWVIPGMDITGDGVVLELPGFVIDVVDIQPLTDGRGAKFQVKIIMMCGCPTEPGGLWDSSKFEMKALIKNNGEVVKTIPLIFTGTTNIYEGQFKVEQPGSYKIMAIVFDPRTENSGLAAETVRLK